MLFYDMDTYRTVKPKSKIATICLQQAKGSMQE